MNEKGSLVSVIIPAYNSASTIVRALESVYFQTYKNIEIILVNDGSEDQTLRVANHFFEAKSDTGLNFTIIDKENGGVSSARNAGMAIAVGDFIAFLDADDEWYAEKIGLQVSLMLEKDIDFLAAGFEGFVFSGRPEGELIEVRLKKLMFKNFFQPSTVVMKSIVLKEIGFFNEAQKYAEEGNYFMRVADKFKCFFLNRVLISFGDGKRGFGVSGLSANLIEMEKGELKNLHFALQNHYINWATYATAFTFSIIKFVRRLIIVTLKTK